MKVAASRAAVDPWADDYDQLAGFKSTRSAVEVRAEYLTSRDEVAARMVEAGDSFSAE